MAQSKAATKKVGTPNMTFDPSTFNVTTNREGTLKRSKSDGIDRSPFYDLLRSLNVGQVVELPQPLDEKSAVSAANIIRASAKDLGLSISFLADSERNNANGTLPEGESFYSWYVKGPYTPKAAKAAQA